jgi:hypothetical protein
VCAHLQIFCNGEAGEYAAPFRYQCQAVVYALVCGNVVQGFPVVHDELVLEVPQEELPIMKEKLRDLMCHVAELKVPLEVGLGEGGNWDEAH